MAEIRIKEYNTKAKLEELGLRVKQNGSVYICRTDRNTLIVVDYGYDRLLEDDVWTIEFANIATANCCATELEMLAILKSYLGICKED